MKIAVEKMKRVIEMDIDHAIALEESEAVYWSKYYDIHSPVKSFVNIIHGAFIGAIPALDILALNRVIGLGMRKTLSSKGIDEIIRYYEKAGSRRFFIQLSPYVIQDDLKEMLKEAGFKLHNHWAKLGRSVETDLSLVQTNLKVREVKPKEASTYGRIIFESFDWDDERLIPWLSQSVAKQGYKHYFALLDGKPIATAALHIMDEYGSMAFAGTLPEFRGMGAQSLLLKSRILDARALGCKYLVSETADPGPDNKVGSHRNMLKMGFNQLYLRENWIYEF